MLIEIDIDELRRLVEYDPATGLFRLLQSKNPTKWIAGQSDDKGYKQIKIANRLFRAHRAAWAISYGSFPKCNIDHINRQKDDNRLINLREAVGSLNHHNKGILRNNTSGIVGVTCNQGKWIGRFQHERRVYRTHYYPTAEEAALARAELVRRIASIHDIPTVSGIGDLK